MDFYNSHKYTKPMQLEYELLKPDGFVKIQDADPKKHIEAKYQALYVPICIIQYIKDEAVFSLNKINTIELTIPKYIQDPDNNFINKINPAWEYAYGDYIIDATNTISGEKERYRISNPDYSMDEQSNRIIKAYSLDREYNSKQLYRFTSKTLDETGMEIDKPWYIREILEHIHTKYMQNTWSIGHIDSNVEIKQRTFDYSKGSVWDFLSQMQDTFNCIFKFDNINRLVNVYDMTVYPVCPKCHKGNFLLYHDKQVECFNPDCYIDVTDNNLGMFDSNNTITVVDTNGKERTVLAKDGEKVNWTSFLYGRDTGLYLNEKNYLIQYQEKINHDKIVTRLYVYGKDDLGINTADENYTGQPYIDDFSFYRNSKYMSDSLLKALDKYDALIESLQGQWIKLNDEHYDLIRQYSEAKVISKNEKDLLSNLQIQLNAIKTMTSLQANGYTTATLDELKEKLSAYWTQADVYIDNNNTKKLGELIEEISELLDGTTQPIVDLANAIKKITDSVEQDFNIMKQAIDKEDLSEYSLEQLEEASNIYDKRIKVLIDISNNIVSADIDSELTTGSVWEKDDKIYYRLIKEDVDKGTASVIFDNFDSPVILNTKTNGFFEINLPSKYTKKIRANNNYRLRIWLSKKKENGTYEDRILQTEDVHYYILETENTSGSIYKIRQNNIDLTVIKNSLNTAIEQKKKEIEVIEQAQEENNKAIQELKEQMAIETAHDDDGLIFEPEYILELNTFIREGTYVNDAIGVSDIVDDTQTDLYKSRVNDLYQDGMLALYKLHTPTIEFSTTVANFLKDLRHQDNWQKLTEGDMVHLNPTDSSSPDRIVRIIESRWSNTSNDLLITFSNEEKYYSTLELFAKMKKGTDRVNSIVSVQKDHWNNSGSNAVDELLNSGWNAAISEITCGSDVNVTVDNQGITLVNTLDNNKQMRITDSCLGFTSDNWNTIRTAINNGNVLADTIIGRFLVGKNLNIIATKADGTTLTFRVDGEGVLIDNGNLTIKPMDGNYSNSNGITLSPDPNEGFKCTGYDSNGKGCFEIKLNAQDGMLMYTLDSSGNPKTYMIKANINGDLLVDGVIYAKDLCLGGLNNQSVITYINANTGKVTDYETGEETKDIMAAIQGEHISCAGLLIKSGNSMFSVNDNAEVTIANGIIKMINNNSELYIDPENFIKWIIDSKPKFYYNKDENSLVFGGTVQTGEDCRVGQNLKVGYDDNGKWSGHGAIQFSKGTISEQDGISGLIVSGDQGIGLMASNVYGNDGTFATQNWVHDYVTKEISKISSNNNPII